MKVRSLLLFAALMIPLAVNSSALGSDGSALSLHAIADLTGDGSQELIYTRRLEHSSVGTGIQSLEVRSSSGSLLWVKAVDYFGGLTSGAVGVRSADARAGGGLELLVSYLRPGDESPVCRAAAGAQVCLDRPTRLSLLDGITGSEIWSIPPQVFDAGGMTFVPDVTGDGYADVFLPGKGKGSVFGYAKSATPGTASLMFEGSTGAPIGVFDEQASAVPDLSGDGKTDVVTLRYTHGVTSQILQSASSTGITRWASTTGITGDSKDIRAGRFGGIPSNDVAVLQNYAGRLYVSCLNGTTGRLMWFKTFQDTDSAEVLGDSNGDGAEDLLLARQDSTAHRLTAISGRNGSIVWGPVTLPAQPSATLDVNGDGVLDYIQSGETSRAINGKDGSQIWAVPGAFTFAGNRGDANSNGTHDLLRFSSAPVSDGGFDISISLYEGSTGALAWTSTARSSYNMVGDWAPQFAQIVGGGDAEVIVPLRSSWNYVVGMAREILIVGSSGLLWTVT